ncbi:MAG: CYTH domain-containing protein [Candidatus Omnitrophica bacterium]|nr:CYTH domain-containing protein [Candidatus Omnitrophota bacterium]
MKIIRAQKIILVAIVCLFVFSSYVRAVVNEEQVKFDVSSIALFKNILRNISEWPVILTYRVKPIGKYIYQDYYYDTPDMTLFRLGYSYRFRIRDKGKENIEYGLQFKSEYDPGNNESFKRLEIDNVIPDNMAQEIMSGKWLEAVSDKYDIHVIKEFLDFLNNNGIPPNALSPVLHADQKRDRFSLKENGMLHFEISLDECVFSLINDTEKKQYEFSQLEFENKYRKGIPSEDQKRIDDLIGYFTQSYNVSIARNSKYKTAILELTKR